MTQSGHANGDKLLAGTARVSRISLKDCRKIWIDEVRNRPAIN